MIAYEKKRNATKKNYCIKLRVMISRSLSKQQKHELAKQFMFNISLDYKSIPFVSMILVLKMPNFCWSHIVLFYYDIPVFIFHNFIFFAYHYHIRIIFFACPSCKFIYVHISFVFFWIRYRFCKYFSFKHKKIQKKYVQDRKSTRLNSSHEQ